MITTVLGNIKVAIKTPSKIFFPGKRNRENPYATTAEDKTVKRVVGITNQNVLIK